MLPSKGLQAQQQHHLLLPHPVLVPRDPELRSQQPIKGLSHVFLNDQVTFIPGSDSAIRAKSSSSMQVLGFIFLHAEMILANFRLRSAQQLNLLELAPLRVFCFPRFTIKDS